MGDHVWFNVFLFCFNYISMNIFVNKNILLPLNPLTTSFLCSNNIQTIQTTTPHHHLIKLVLLLEHLQYSRCQCKNNALEIHLWVQLKLPPFKCLLLVDQVLNLNKDEIDLHNNNNTRQEVHGNYTASVNLYNTFNNWYYFYL